MIDIRPFDFAKEWPHYCALHHRVRGRPVDQVYVNWKFLENPAGQGFGFGAWDGDKLVGFAGMEPRKFWIQGKEETAGRGEEALTDPEYRDKELIAKLNIPLLEEMNRRGWLWHYLVPGKETLPVYTNELGHRQVAEIPYWVKLRPGRIIRRMLGFKNNRKETVGFRMVYKSYKVRMVREFDESFDQLWERARGEYPIEPVKTRENLDWRYIKHPMSQYKILTVENQGKLKGFAVLDGGMVSELFCEVDTDAYKTLAKAINKVGKSQKQDISHAWILGDRLAERALAGQGWREWEKGLRPFGLHPKRSLVIYPNPMQEKTALALRAGNWRLFIGEMDNKG